MLPDCLMIEYLLNAEQLTKGYFWPGEDFVENCPGNLRDGSYSSGIPGQKKWKGTIP